MKLYWLRQLAGKELSDEKIKDFRRIVTVQVVLIVFCLLIREFFHFVQLPFALEIAELVFFAVLGIYVFFLWDMLRLYAKSKLFIAALFVVIMGVFLFASVLINPFQPLLSQEQFKTFGTFIQTCLLTVEISVIYYTMKEFFKKDLGMNIKLWGAACLYLMIGISFGSVYEIVCVFDIDCLGVEIPLRASALMDRISYSFLILSGLDNPLEGIATVVTRISILESLWSNLFIVLIVGRLLVK